MSGKAEPRSIHTYYRYQSISDISDAKFRGPFRVIVFLILTILLPCMLLVAPLYLRYYIFQDVEYHVGESDLITVDKPISTFWCEGQDLWMNHTKQDVPGSPIIFNAYLLDEQPKISEDLQHLELDKHMQLADDSLEYWGFFLLQGSKVILSVCSRYEGARLMVVKGTKNLKQCALLENNAPKNPNEVDPWDDNISGKDIQFSFHGGEEQKHSVNFKIKKRIKGRRNLTSIAPPLLSLLTSPVPSITIPSSTTTTSTPSSTTVKLISSTSERHPRKPGRKKVQFSMMRNDQVVEVSTKKNEMHSRSKRGISIPIKDEKKKVQEYDEEYEEEEEEDGGDEEGEEIDEEEMEDEEDLEDDDKEESPNPVGIEPDILEEEEEEEEIDDDVTIDEEDIRSSGSSFAKNLWSCYGGDTLFTQSFSPSLRCQSQDAMMKHAIRMRTVHEITQTGYYYYIFYSDNDILLNDIFARFNIEKIQYTFPNFTSSCLNATQCSLPLTFLSSEKVLLEVPLQDGVSDEDALAQMILISTCRPRLAVYFMFPCAILFLIMCCAFL